VAESTSMPFNYDGGSENGEEKEKVTVQASEGTKIREAREETNEERDNQ